MNLNATTFLHATKPGHLPFGKLMNGYLQQRHHLVILKVTQQIERDVLIFESIPDEPLCGHSPINEPLHLVNHAFFQTGTQAPTDLLATEITTDVQSNDEGVEGRELSPVELISFDDTLDIHARSSTKDGRFSSLRNSCISVQKTFLPLIHVVSRSCLGDVYQMVRNILVLHMIIRQVLPRADVHTAIHLTAVRTDNLPIHIISQLCSKSGLATSSRS